MLQILVAINGCTPPWAEGLSSFSTSEHDSCYDFRLNCCRKMIPSFCWLVLIFHTLPETVIRELLQAGFNLSSFNRYLSRGNCSQLSHGASLWTYRQLCGRLGTQTQPRLHRHFKKEEGGNNKIKYFSGFNCFMSRLHVQNKKRKNKLSKKTNRKLWCLFRKSKD